MKPQNLPLSSLVLLPSSTTTTTATTTGVARGEWVRLLLQNLRNLGYNSAAAALELESCVTLQSPSVAQFKHSVLDGQWELLLDMLERTPPFSTELSHSQTQKIRFIISRQKYLELLEAGLTKEALVVLRNQITPAAANSTPSSGKNTTNTTPTTTTTTTPASTQLLHQLTGLLMCRNIEDMRTRANWVGVAGGSRLHVLTEIQAVIPASIMMPENRLTNLIAQAIDHQISHCLYHNPTNIIIPASSDGSGHAVVSLLSDHKCERSDFPIRTSHILEHHSDEVWFVGFSHNGLLLGSASKDTTAIVWDISPATTPNSSSSTSGGVVPIRSLAGHKEAISFLAWSPCDKMLLTASNDKTLKLWMVQSGSCEQTYSRHNDVVTSCAWLPSGKQFISGSQDKYIYLWNIEGQVLHRWSGVRVHDLSVNHDGRWLIAITERKMMMYSLTNPGGGGGAGSSKWGGGANSTSMIGDGNTSSSGSGGYSTSQPLSLFSPPPAPPTSSASSSSSSTITDLEDMPLLATLIETDPITSVSVSEDGRYALVNLCTQEIHLWDLEQRKSVRKYLGQKQGRFVIRSCFGGVSQGFVLSGSEDSQIYVWHRQRGDLLEQLSGHSGCVNCVSWNPRFNMFASASDDYTIRLWST